MSMTFRSYRFRKYCSQMRLIFSTASADFNVEPLTYKRKMYFAGREGLTERSNSPANPSFRLSAGPLFFSDFFMQVFLYLVSLPYANPGPPTAARCWTGLQ